MKLGHYVLNTIVGLTAVLFSSMVFAEDKTCPTNLSSGLAQGNPGGFLTVNTAQWGSVWGAVVSENLAGYSLVDCTSYINHGLTRWEYYKGNSTQIDILQTYTFGGKTYYKLKNTSSVFLNKYGYITFKFSESFGPHLNLTDAFPVRIFYENATGILATASQGIELHGVDFIYTAAPTESEQVEINLGTLEAKYLSTDAPGDVFFAKEDAYITVNLKPEPNHTCDFDIPPVQMSTIPLSQLESAGAQTGSSRFTVKVNCDTGLAGELLHYIMNDSTHPDNMTDVLTNTQGTTSNVGIKIYEYENRNPVFFNTEYEFGRLSGGSFPTVSKVFYAKYYRIDDTPLNAGYVTAEAMISVVYK